ncbi:MAG: hypothetical protein A2315_02700 [Ignavibacteria bacterium RIFOXYB2_FULL_35_12]|nr:MAG: hypothetical protein A2058_06590 [Ignavibacteria bacterium GWA2_36_19]OGU50202.1 MAG: hypothetical protein A2006_06820 [Ignavibacteria bacterium GWC2_35_8]OGU56204.1 MAG: hypothetical protein A2X60_06835 [Ignavibacteria bacterium GWF2_35_20]OGU83400.1 MAG: hypothetical protein A2254_14005 [Ignavibacteria bacterium RIFOXYA2_FULL_35_9]OGU86716.1 MAG: hypothetical protein A2492_02885 [Ignavibacteria bacterium RIFOXYC12_FULL_35_11]OGU89411.1 MAG: hypothetical protein A3K31_14625 [Ignavibac
MKLTFIISLLISLSIFAQNEKRTVTFDKNTQGGFNIYSNSGELLYAYNKKNCDSTTLETLNDIFFKGDSKNKSEVAVINLEEKGFDWSNIIIACATFIGTLGGLLLGNRLSKITQLDYYRRTLEVERRKEWIAHLGNYVAEYIGLTNEIYYQIQTMALYNESPLKSQFHEVICDSIKSCSITYKELQVLFIKINLLLNSENKKHDELYGVLKKADKVIMKLYESMVMGIKSGIYSTDKFIDYDEFLKSLSNLIKIVIEEAEKEIRNIQLAKSANFFSKLFNNKKYKYI